MEHTADDDAIQHRLWAAFVSRAILPGQPVIVDALASQMHAEPDQLCRALDGMADRGLVSRIAPRSYSARELLTSRELAELYVVRNRLEPWLAEEAAKAVIVTEFGEQLRSLATVPSSPTLTELAARDSQFHALVGSLSGLSFASRAVESLNSAFHIYRRLDGHSYAPASDNEHLAIAEALLARDPMAAKLAMQKHLSSSTTRLIH